MENKMVLQKTSKTFLTNEEILKYIEDYESKTVPHLNELWEYYKGKNVKILNRKTPDANSPDNRIVVSYGRKLINTYTGYAYRPKYITYKANEKKTDKEIDDIENDLTTKSEPVEKKYVNGLQDNYNTNNEHIKTNRAGRNTAIFGFSYEICYIDGEYSKEALSIKAIPKFFTVDPREMIVLYDFSPEPKIVLAIRYYKMESDYKYKVEVYYKDHIDTFIRQKKDAYTMKWELVPEQLGINNYYNTVPVVAYYLGDEMQSIMENVLTLIDAYDILFSDSMNEFDRFAFAYLIMKKFGLTNPLDKKDPVKANSALQFLKRRRVFENLDEKADIKFLTKDIPVAFIQHIGEQLKMQIHLQSHIPDFNQLTGALSGAAIDRLLFDFENLVSSAEADFDLGLIARGKLITDILITTSFVPKDSDMNTMVQINHKRNKPLNTLDFAQTANILMQAGFSRRAIVSTMPEDIIPDVEQELEEEKMEQEAMIGLNNINTTIDLGNAQPNPDEQKQIDDLVASGMNEQDAINQVMGGN
jgi:SPP1 family phage portal protein